jgi:radical S-adenosyl methionine domain-containing protein 2
LESVSIVNNGSKVTEKWMSEYAYYLDIMAVSCDSFDGETNRRIGRFAKVSRLSKSGVS